MKRNGDCMNYVVMMRIIQGSKEILGLVANDRLVLTLELAKAKRYLSAEAAEHDVDGLKRRYGPDVDVRVVQACSELNRNSEIHKFTSRMALIVQHYGQNTIMIGPYENKNQVEYLIYNSHTDLLIEVDFPQHYGKISGVIADRVIDGFGTSCAEYEDLHKLLSDLNDSLLGHFLM